MSSSRSQLETDVWKLMWDYKSNRAMDAQMKNLNADLHGPKDSLYQGWVWNVGLVLPDENDYPNNPPTIRFTNKIYHPNVDEGSGLVSLNVINQAWSPTFGLLNVFEVFLPQLLLSPNPSDQLNEEAAALMMSDLPAYEQRVKEYCEKYAKPEDEAVSSEEKTSDEERSEANIHSSDETVAAIKPDHVHCHCTLS